MDEETKEEQEQRDGDGDGEGGGMDMEGLFEQAIKIKESRNSVFRRRYDFWPSFYQHSLFSREDVIEARKSLDFNGRIDFATKCKLKGNDYFAGGEYQEAINEYERSLSMFCWVEPLSANWRREEIEDDKLKERTYVPLNDDEKSSMNKLMVSCYLNLAATYQKTKDWTDSFEACNYAITLEPKSGRAYFRRAQARILPASSGRIGDEELLALCDLRVAHSLSPENQEITRTYVTLSLAVDEHRKKEKELYRKAFGKKTSLEDGGETSTPKKKRENKEGKESKESKVGYTKEKDRASKVEKDAAVAAKKEKIKKALGSVDREDLTGTTNGHGNGSSSGSSSSSSSGAANEGGKVTSNGTSKSGTSGSGSGSIPATTAAAKPTATPPMGPEKPPAVVKTPASAGGPITTLDEAMVRIKEVEARAEQLKKDGRHADALILTEKAKTARQHIESMYAQQAKADRLQKQLMEAEERERNMAGKGMRLRGNLFVVDFMNPSQAVIEDAKVQGLDLSDNRAKRIMMELQKEALASKERSAEWANSGYPVDNPEGKDDFVARVIDKVYKAESRELASKLIDGLTRGVLLTMLRARRRHGPQVDMGDSACYAMSADAKHLAAVVIAGAGMGVLSGLREYEAALAAGADGVLKLRQTTAGGAQMAKSTTASAPAPSAAAKREKKDGTELTLKMDGSHANNGTINLIDDAQTEADLEDMSKDQLRLLILPFLAGDLFAIWRETDIAAEREKRRQRRKLLGKGELTLFGESEDDIVPYTAEELVENKILADLSPEDRLEYEKNKREQVVYTMLQDKYGLEEDQIYNEEDQKRFQANLLQHKIRPIRGGFLDPMYIYIVGVVAVLVYLLIKNFHSQKHATHSVDLRSAASAYTASAAKAY